MTDHVVVVGGHAVLRLNGEVVQTWNLGVPNAFDKWNHREMGAYSPLYSRSAGIIEALALVDNTLRPA